MKRKRILLISIGVLFLAAVIFREKLIQRYVVVNKGHLEVYAEKQLDGEGRKRDRYGAWKTRSHPEEGVVEFMTGGFGLAPSSVYKGFYYARDNEHKIFSVADKSLASMEVDGDHACWTDGTDNHGTSDRIKDRWFWFEASF